jgi:membrane AbrB-like protein
MFACLSASLAGFRLRGAPRVTNTMRTILGVAIGASITPALLDRLPEMGISLLMMPLLVVTIALVGYPFFRHVCGFDHPTSYYAAMPGGLQDMLVFGEEAGGDVRALGLIHATRVLIIVTLLPMIFAFGLHVDLTAAPGEPVSAIPLQELIIMGVVAIVGWQGAKAVGMFGASILGPLILTAALSLTDVLHHRPPAEAIYAAQFFIGFAVGVKYSGITLGELSKDVVAGIGYTLLIFLIAIAFAALAISLGLVPFIEGLLVFSPGGQAEMAILALVAGADVAFVVAHHLVRIFTVILGAPVFAQFFR